LITRGIEDELLPLCTNEGVGVCVYNPLAGGLLTGKHDPNRPPPQDTRFGNKQQGKTYSDRYWSPDNFDAVTRFKEVAGKQGHSMPQLSLAWILNNIAITSVLCGANSVKQLEENIGATNLVLTEEELKVCDEVWHHLRPPRFSYGR